MTASSSSDAITRSTFFFSSLNSEVTLSRSISGKFTCVYVEPNSWFKSLVT
jgi:hypothetical protein